MAKIYISSTFSDLEECRKSVYRALRSMRHDVIAMEDYVATDQRPLDKCLADVASCDIYVGIFAWRYGYVPVKDNHEQKSITELEFRHAVKMGKTCLLFLLEENAPWPMSKAEQGAGSERIRKLREELSTDYTVSFFQNCDHLASLASAAVTNVEQNRLASQVESTTAPPLAPKKISIGRLPVTGLDLFGREQELQQLNEAWANQKTHVLSLVAWGGVGKSALVNHWLALMAEDDYRSASCVYGWSFYSQGTTDRAVSADQFIEAALVFFGDTDPNRGSPWDKGERLARLVGAQRSLLILDGLEPLQYPPGPQEGRLKDQSLQALLRQLAAYNEGLCIISTRAAVTDLGPFESHTATRIDLETLSPQAGAQVLRAQGVKGSQAELEQVSRDFGGHSLALTLLGSYLSDVYEGDVTRSREVKGLEEDEKHGRHAQKVMSSYEKWFGEGPELAVLRMLGLFKSPADKKAIDSLRAAPAIEGLTDTLRPLSKHKWQQVLAKLRRTKLLAERDPNQPDTLDAHPLVREHFGQKLKLERPVAWKAGNYRLYNHYKKLTKVFPDTIEEMAPLFAAVDHGCEAGKHQEALDEVYWKRIQRGEAAFGTLKLGAFSAALASLSRFFDTLWLQPVTGLTESDRSFVQAEAGFFLKSSGRLEEATQPLQAALESRETQEPGSAAKIAHNLSELYCTLGELSQAQVYAQQSVELADKSGDSFIKLGAQSALGDILHKLGRLSEAEAIFHKAEEIQKKQQPEFPILYSLQGFRYYELLLDQIKYQQVQTYAVPALEWAKQYGNLFSIALGHLTMGQVYLLKARCEDIDLFSQATDHLNQAVNTLRQVGMLDNLPAGLLTRAELHRVKGDLNKAQADLDEAMNIATHARMRLHEADGCLEYARLYLAQGEKEKARESWARAKEMIERMGYGRRDRDVREIGELLKEE